MANSKEHEDDIPITEKLLDKVGLGKYQYLTYFWMFLICMTEGAEMVIMSLLNYVLVYVVWFESLKEVAIIGTVVFFCAAAGGILSGSISDRHGRKLPIIISGILSGLAGIASSFSPNMFVLVLTRGIFGFVYGIFAPAVIAYLSEITPKSNRGIDYILASSGITIGQAFAIEVAAILSIDDEGSEKWRTLFIIVSIPSILGALLYCKLCDESPRFKILKNVPEGAAILDRMHLANNKTNLDLKDSDYQELEKWSEEQRNAMPPASLKELFADGMWRITLPLWGGYFVICVLYYGGTYILPVVMSNLEMALTHKPPGAHGLKYTDIITPILWEIPSTILAGFMVRRKEFGRKNSLAISLIIITISTLCVYYQPNHIIFFSSLMKFFGQCALKFIVPLTTDLYNTRCRVTGMGWAASANRLGGTLMPTICLIGLNLGPVGPFLLFGYLGIAGIIFCFLLPKDRTGLSLDTKLDEIEMKSYKKLAEEK